MGFGLAPRTSTGPGWLGVRGAMTKERVWVFPNVYELQELEVPLGTYIQELGSVLLKVKESLNEEKIEQVRSALPHIVGRQSAVPRGPHWAPAASGGWMDSVGLTSFSGTAQGRHC